MSEKVEVERPKPGHIKIKLPSLTGGGKIPKPGK